MTSITEAKAIRWEASATVAVDTDWFTNDLQGEESNRTYKHTLEIMVPTASIVNIQKKNGGTTKVLNLNSGTALTANAGYHFSVLIGPGDSYNVQHKTGTQNVACRVYEANNTDI